MSISSTALIAHRGSSRIAPENTIAAFRAAIDAGVEYFETDLTILADGVVAILHDDTVDRTTNGSGSIRAMTSGEVRRLDAGSWFAPQFTNEPVPFLEDVVGLLATTHVSVNLELKADFLSARSGRLLVDRTLELMRPFNDRVLYSSFNSLLLEYLRRRDPAARIACLYETVALYEDWRFTTDALAAEAIHPEDTDLNEQRVAEFLAAGLEVNVWTVNDPRRAALLQQWGVSRVITDDIARLKGHQ